MAGVDLGTAIRARSALCPPHLPWAEPACSMAEADLGIAVGARCALRHGLSRYAQWLKPTLVSPLEHAVHCVMGWAGMLNGWGRSWHRRLSTRRTASPRLPWAEPVLVCSMAGIPVKVAIAPNSWDHYVSLSPHP
jgi:hypothetical protein